MQSLSDVHDRITRSRNMAAIRGKNTKPELLVRKALHARGLRHRLHDPGLPGKPDLVFPKYRTVVFVNGCFWHAHSGCRFFKIPKTDTEKWRNKLLGNRERDQQNQKTLENSGWRVIVVWECEVKGLKGEGIFLYFDALASQVRGK